MRPRINVFDKLASSATHNATLFGWFLSRNSHVQNKWTFCDVFVMVVVFEREVDFAAAPDVFPPDRFNAGVMLIVMLFVLSPFRSHHLWCWLT